MKLAPVISIIGPEGAGKSTTVTALHKYLQSHGHNAKIVFLGRGKNNIIPINELGKKYKEKEIQQLSIKTTTNTSKRLTYTLISLALALDLLLRYAVQVLPSRVKGITIICDRYSSDLYLMDKVPRAVRTSLLLLFPKPAKTFYLYNTIEELHQRKGRSKENLQWQMEQFTVLNRKYAAIAIKTDHKEETLQQIIENLKPFLS